VLSILQKKEIKKMKFRVYGFCGFDEEYEDMEFLINLSESETLDTILKKLDDADALPEFCEKKDCMFCWDTKYITAKLNWAGYPLYKFVIKEWKLKN